MAPPDKQTGSMVAVSARGLWDIPAEVSTTCFRYASVVKNIYAPNELVGMTESALHACGPFCYPAAGLKGRGVGRGSAPGADLTLPFGEFFLLKIAFPNA